ncbi:MAG: endolytic transglycosylase MltG [Deferrisomatales bacterium]
MTALGRLGWFALAALLLALATGALRLAQYVHQPQAVGTVYLDVAPGTGPARFAAALEEAGLGPWPLGTRLGHRLWGHPESLKAGRYVFSGPVRLVDVFASVEAGRVEQVEVTLPEGLTAREMAPLLERAGVTDGEAFAALAHHPTSPSRWEVPGPSLEGFLFPDTYRFARGVAAERVVDAMVGRFRAVARELEATGGGEELGLLEWVTLASIVEKEAGAPGEKPLVAAVFHNRLRQGMRLESDPTVIYGLESFDGNLRRADLRRDTPYNTYTRPGLPPGPICNPGRASLEAARHPAEVPYLYFVSRNDGTHAFSETYAEHRRNVDRFQRRRAR